MLRLLALVLAAGGLFLALNGPKLFLTDQDVTLCEAHQDRMRAEHQPVEPCGDGSVDARYGLALLAAAGVLAVIAVAQRRPDRA